MWTFLLACTAPPPEPLPPQPGLAVAVEYLGLPGNPVVTVNFRQDR